MSISPSATADSLIYVTEQSGAILAIRSDGTEQWRYKLADDLKAAGETDSTDFRIDSLAARSGGLLIAIATSISGAHAGQAILFALNANQLLWHRVVPQPEPGVSPLAVGSDAVYEAGDDGVLYAFSRSDGRPLWKFQVSQGTLGSPLLGSDGTVYVVGPGHKLHAIGPDGAERWRVETDK
jgi:outer membrane protein assembly factor BamB